MRHAILAAGFVAYAAALQFPHGNALRNALHERQPGAALEAERVSKAREDSPATSRPTQTAAYPEVPTGGSSTDDADEANADAEDLARRTLVVTRETSVYLPGPAAPTHAAPPAPPGVRVGKSAPATGLPGSRRSPPAHILDTVRRLGFVVGLAKWMVRKPSAAAWWILRVGSLTAWDLTWRATIWSLQTARSGTRFAWEWVIVPSSAPFLIPFNLFVVVPLSILSTIFIMLRPVIILISSACLLGFLLGLVGGFSSSIVGDWVSQRSQVLLIGAATAGARFQNGGRADGYGPQVEQAPRKGMVWAEKPSVWGDEDSDFSDVDEGQSSSQWFDQPAVQSPPLSMPQPPSLYAGRSPSLRGSYTSSRQGASAARRGSMGESSTMGSIGLESPMERKGSLISGATGRSPRPGMPKKKVTFDGTLDER